MIAVLTYLIHKNPHQHVQSGGSHSGGVKKAQGYWCTNGIPVFTGMPYLDQLKQTVKPNVAFYLYQILLQKLPTVCFSDIH